VTTESTVTVVIPVYNGERFVAAAIQSALDQGSAVREVLVCDDGSTDGTRDAVRRFPARVRLVEKEHSGNPSVVRNAGIDESATELVAFLDADDVWLPGKLEQQLKALEANPDAAFVCTNALRQTEPGQAQGMLPLLPTALAPTEDALDSLIAENFVITSSVLCRRDVLVSAGMFPTDVHLPAVEDYDCWLRVAALGKVAYLPEPWLVYRDWGASYRGEWSALETARGLLHVLERLEERMPGTEAAHATAFRARRIALYEHIYGIAMRLGQGAAARDAAMRIFRLAPFRASSLKRLARSMLPSTARG
jgi:GT2 family glycosyltransferase